MGTPPPAPTGSFGGGNRPFGGGGSTITATPRTPATSGAVSSTRPGERAASGSLGATPPGVSTQPPVITAPPGGNAPSPGSFGGGNRPFGGGSVTAGRRDPATSGVTSATRPAPRAASGNLGVPPVTTPRAPGGGSFGPSSYQGRPTAPYVYRGRPSVAAYRGGWSDYSYGWGAPRWYYYTPFSPFFYFHPPLYTNGVYVSGGFHWLRLFLTLGGLVGIAFLIRAMLRERA